MSNSAKLSSEQAAAQAVHADSSGVTMPCSTIEPQNGWQLVDVRELWAYRDLLYFLVRRNVQVLYKQTVLGFAWAVIRPFLTMIIFSVVFGRLARVPSDGIPYPIFSYAALVPWIYFATAMTQSTESLVTSANLLTKVYFPRIMIPLTPVIAGLVDFVIALVMLAILMVVFRIEPTLNVVFMPLLVILMVLTATGIGMWLSAMAIQYRDIKYAIHFLVQVLMYAAPVAWPASLLPSRFRVIYGLYPMAGVIEGFRSALLGGTSMPWDLILPGTVVAIVLFVTGAVYFRSMERRFAGGV